MHALEVRILGCGSSGGVPRLGGADGAGYWGACDPANPEEPPPPLFASWCAQKSAAGETRVLVDTSPDMREQLLDARDRPAGWRSDHP